MENKNNLDLQKILLNISYDTRKTLKENYNEILLSEGVTTYQGPFYPRPLGSGDIGTFADYNYSDGKRFKTGVAGSKFSVEKTEIGSGGNVVTVVANDLGIKFRYSCKSNTDKSYAFKFKRGDIYDKEKWNKNCCTKVQDWNVDYWNDEDGTDNWAIPGLGPQLYKDYCVKKKKEDVKDYTPDNNKKNNNKINNQTPVYKQCTGTYYYGCISDKIGEAQQCLKDERLYPYRVDSKFGDRTLTAIRSKLGKSTFTDSDLQTICKSDKGGGGGDNQNDFDQDFSEKEKSTDTTWTGDVY